MSALLANENYCPKARKKSGKGANRHHFPKRSSSPLEPRRCSACGYKEGSRLPQGPSGYVVETDLGGRQQRRDD